MTTTSSAAATTQPHERPVLKIRTPGEICEAVPFLLGFEPARSIVVVSLRGERLRVGLVARVDILDDPALADRLAGYLGDQLERDRAAAALLVAYAEAGDPSPDPFMAALQDMCARRGLPVAEALRVTAGRWTSYTCGSACCPPSGTPVVDRVREPGLTTATMVADGRRVAASREALAESMAPVGGLLAAAMSDRLCHELERFVDVMCAGLDGSLAPLSVGDYADETVALVRASLEGPAAELTVDRAARLIAGLHDRGARDRCLSSELGRLPGDRDPVIGPEALELWRELVRRAVVPGTVAPVATLLAGAAYLDHGDGALANVALDRALADDPEYLLALYLRTFLASGTPPSALRGWVTGDGSGDPPAEPAPGTGVSDGVPA